MAGATDGGRAETAGALPRRTAIARAANPVAQVRQEQELGVRAVCELWEWVWANRYNFSFSRRASKWAKLLTPVLHAGIFSGQFEFGGNIMPLWQAYTPAPHTATYTVDPNGTALQLPVGGGTYRGVSLTPVIFRWNFLTKSRPLSAVVSGRGRTDLHHAQVSAGPAGCRMETPGGTCVWNFSPQGGGGFHYFTRAKRSIDLGVNGVHISSASLGDRNPGVNASIQVQVGYTFWK